MRMDIKVTLTKNFSEKSKKKRKSKIKFKEEEEEKKRCARMPRDVLAWHTTHNATPLQVTREGDHANGPHTKTA